MLDSLNFLIDFFLPPICPVCGRFDENLKLICKNCEKEVKKRVRWEEIEVEGFKKFFVVFPYDDFIERLIHLYKYRRKFVFLKIFVEAFWDNFYRDFKGKIDFLIPVPLHPARHKERGFNQSFLILKELSNRSGIKIFKGLKRKVNTRSQANLGREERMQNVKDAFCIENGSILKGKNILIFDDLITTGATLKECLNVLKNFEILDSYGLVLASSRII